MVQLGSGLIFEPQQNHALKRYMVLYEGLPHFHLLPTGHSYLHFLKLVLRARLPIDGGRVQGKLMGACLPIYSVVYGLV